MRTCESPNAYAPLKIKPLFDTFFLVSSVKMVWQQWQCTTPPFFKCLVISFHDEGGWKKMKSSWMLPQRRLFGYWGQYILPCFCTLLRAHPRCRNGQSTPPAYHHPESCIIERVVWPVPSWVYSSAPQTCPRMGWASVSPTCFLPGFLATFSRVIPSFSSNLLR